MLEELEHLLGIDLHVVKYDKLATFERNGDLIDLNFCGLDKAFTGEIEVSPYRIKYKKGAIFRVSLGFAMAMPVNKKANIYPRSGTRKNFNVILTNSVGQIDNDYKGSNDIWMAEFYAIGDGQMNLGDRILQFDITDVMRKVNIIEVDNLSSESRGGYGSTGV